MLPNFKWWQPKAGLIIVMGLLSAMLAGAGCARVASFDSRLASAVKPYTYSKPSGLKTR